jgi:hypothetical protein
MADQQLESSGPQVSEVESNTDQPQQPQEQPPGQQPNSSESQNKTTSNGSFFTIDDVPYSKRYVRLNEFRAWVNSQLAKGVSLRQTLTELCSRFTSTLNDWYSTMGEYRQLQLVQLSYADFFGFMYREFVVDPGLLQKKF